MIIIKFFGGLGNQMFQYKFFENLKNIGYEVKADITHYDNNSDHNGFELEEVFELNIPKATASEINSVKEIRALVGQRVFKHFFGIKSSHIRQNNFEISSLEDGKDYYLEGYWQAEKYVLLSNEKTHFKFRYILNKIDTSFCTRFDDLNKTEFVSVHIRRGDYLTPKNAKHFAQCSPKYYKEAISFFENKYPEAFFLIFSNDIEWCMKNIDLKSRHRFIDNNFGQNSFKDLQLMSLCKHNIIANSSFSWWGAYLNKNKNKTVIAPQNWWLDETRQNDIYIPESWKILPNE